MLFTYLVFFLSQLYNMLVFSFLIMVHISFIFTNLFVTDASHLPAVDHRQLARISVDHWFPPVVLWSIL